MTDHPTPDPRAVLADPAVLDERSRRAVLQADLRDRTADRSQDRGLRSRRDRAVLKREVRTAERADREDRRTHRRKVRAERTAARSEWVRARVDYVRDNAPAVYSSVIYGASLGVAVTGQITAATSQGWPAIVGVGIAVFVEGMALTMALTAHQLRMKRERALIPRTLTWVFAMFAAAVNFVAHDGDPVLAAVLAASSLAGITVWEVRSGAKNRPALRKLGALPEPAERFGIRRWLRYPRSTFAAWSLDIRDRVTPRAAELIAAADLRRTGRRQDRDRARLVRASAFAVRMAALRGPSQALAVLRASADLIGGPAVPEVRAVPARGPQDRAVPATPKPPRSTREPAEDRESHGTATISPIDAGSDERFLKLVRAAHPNGPVTWVQVRDAIRPHLPSMGLQESKGRIKRVREKLLAERGLADDSERDRELASA